MTIYAKLNDQNIVINIIVADVEFINSSLDKNDYKLLTRGGIGWTYDKISDVFIAPKPYPSWLLNESHEWQASTEYPSDGKIYVWDESSLNWITEN
jgi:hypothetical protein